MIDFENIVENLLWEFTSNSQVSPYQTTNPAVPSAPIGNEQKTKSNQNETEEAKAGSIQQFLTDPKKYDSIKIVFNNRYDTTYKSFYKFPEKMEYDNIIRTASFNAIRGTKDSSKYQNIRSIFPLLDLVGLLTQVYKIEQKPTLVKASLDVYNDFINKLEASKGSPLEYQPNSVWAKDVKLDHFNDQDKLNFGGIVLNSPDFGPQSLYFVILKLLEIRRKGMSGILDLKKIPPSKNFIDSILFDPNSYITGKLPIPGNDIKALYNDVSPQLILDVARKAYELFKQQMESKLGNDKALQNIQEREAFKLFLTNQVDWNKYKSIENASIDISFNELYKSVLNEQEPINAEESKSNDFFDTTKTLFPYRLENIIKHKNDVPQAGNLCTSLERLANFIREKAKLNVAGILQGTAQLAKGLSFGAKAMGT